MQEPLFPGDKTHDAGFFRAIVETVPEAIIMATPQGSITYLNPAAERLLGYDLGEVVGASITLLVPLQPDRRADPVKWLARWAAEPLPEQSRRLDFQARRKDGRELTVEVRVTSGEAEGAPCFFITFRDITARRQEQIALKDNQLRAARILMIAEDAIVSCDADQKITFFNLKAETLFGYSAEEALGRPLSDLVPFAARGRHPALVEAFGRGQAASRLMGDRAEVTGLRRSGEIFPVEASITKVETGGTITYTAHIRDITGRKRAEADLLERDRRLRAVFDHATGAVALLTPDGAVVEINPSALDLTQGAEIAPQGKRLWELAWGGGAPSAEGEARRAALKGLIEQAAKGAPATLRLEGGGADPVGGFTVVATPVAGQAGVLAYILVEAASSKSP